MKKKLISLALSAAMLFAGFSISAFAEEPLTGSEPEPAAAEAVEEEENSLFRKPAAEQKPETTEGEAADETAEPEEEKQPLYVALGDSICAGVGLTSVQYAHNLMGVDVSYNFKGYPDACYVGQVAQTLGLDRDHAINLGLPGLMSADLLDMVRNGRMPQMNQASGSYYVYPEYQDYLRNADVISIQIGSNDALVPCIVSLGEATHWKSEQLANMMVSGFLRDFNFQKFGMVLEALNKMWLTFDESSATTRLLFRGMNEICNNAYASVTSDLPQIVAAIRELNPDAKIVLLGYTNPVPMIPAWNSYFKRLNNFAKDLAQQEGLVYVAIPKTETASDGHPTVKGHQYIAKQILNALQ